MAASPSSAPKMPSTIIMMAAKSTHPAPAVDPRCDMASSSLLVTGTPAFWRGNGGAASCARDDFASDQLELAGPADRLAAVTRRQLPVDALEVRLDRVDGDVHLAGDLGGVQHAGHVPQHLPLAFGERLDGQGRGSFGGARRCRGLIVALVRCEQAPVDAGPFRVAPQHRPDPAALHDERQPELLTLSQL